MPAPIPAHLQRFTANPSRPARYRPGKPLQEDGSSDEEEEDEEVNEVKAKARKPKPRAKPAAKAQQQQVEDDEDDDEDGFVTDEEDEADGGAPVAVALAQTSSTGPAQEVAQRSSATASAGATQPQDESEEDEDSGSEEDSEEESSSEDEQPQRKFLRPTFIKKTDRQAGNTKKPDTEPIEISTTYDTEETTARRLAEAEQLIKATIERETAARLAGKKSWDDEELPPEALVDDTDGQDPETEHAAWRLRELYRLKRDREAMITREKELEEIERRRNLTKEEREAEDRAHIERQQSERDGRAQGAYLSKYHHKGAFFMDDEDSARLAKRDLVGAKFADDVDKSVLPEYMRIRDMTKLGKKGRTRYTDLKDTDTGRFGEDVKRWRGVGYEDRERQDTRGLDERYLPNDDRRAGPQVSGANASVLGDRRKRSRSRSPRGREGRSYRRRSSSHSRERRRSYSNSRSRSVSSSRRRRRSPPSAYDRDKRRKIEN